VRARVGKGGGAAARGDGVDGVALGVGHGELGKARGERRGRWVERGTGEHKGGGECWDGWNGRSGGGGGHGDARARGSLLCSRICVERVCVRSPEWQRLLSATWAPPKAKPCADRAYRGKAGPALSAAAMRVARAGSRRNTGREGALSVFRCRCR
jgi:hypothetical protein